MNLTPTRLILAGVLLIALFIGGLFFVLELKGSASSPLFIAMVEAPVPADASIPSTGLVLAARSGMARMYAGYANVPAGAFVFSFLQEGGVSFDAHWSSVRGYEATFTTADTLPSWTNPTTCTAPATECGHLVVAIPSQGPPQIPDFYSINGAAEAAVAGHWTLQPGSLNLQSTDYHVIETTAADVPAGAEVTLRWLAWDGRGHPLLPPTP